MELLKRIIIWFVSLPENPLKKIIRDIFYGDVVSERIFEYSIVLSHLRVEPSKRIKILDVGCYYSNFPLQLASMGYSTFGLDIQAYPLKHPNLRFMKGDITKLNFGSARFDVITCISVLEHIGLGVYGDGVLKNNDAVAVKKMREILKPKGRLLLTVPFGKKTETASYKSYDYRTLSSLLKGFVVNDRHFFLKKGGKWFEIKRPAIENMDNRITVNGVIFIEAERL